MEENKQEMLEQAEAVAESNSVQENASELKEESDAEEVTSVCEQVTAEPVPVPLEMVPDQKSKYQPISAWGYFGIFLLVAIPVIGWIFVLVWALGGCRKVNKRNMARGILLNILLQVILIVIALAVAGSFWVKSGLKDTFTEIQRIVEQMDIQKLGSAVREIDPETLEALSKLQDMDPEVINGLTQVMGNVETDEEGQLDANGLINVIQNIQGLDSETVSQYLEDPTVKEFMNNPELLEKLQKLEGLTEVTSIEDAKRLMEKLEDLSGILGNENYQKLADYLKNLK